MLQLLLIGGDIGHFLERKAEDNSRPALLRFKAAAERLECYLKHL